MTRKSASQSKHDSLVQKDANALKNRGFKVKADIPGFSKPPTFYGYRPDIVAMKGRKRVIEEIETEDSLNSARDLSQQAAFKRVETAKKNTSFKRRIAR